MESVNKLIVYTMIAFVVFAFTFVNRTCALLHTTQSVKSPVLLIPGDGGSQAFCKQNGSSSEFFIWLNLEYFIWSKDMYSYFGVEYNRETGEISDHKSCMVLFPGWGSTETIENLDTTPHSFTGYFKTLVTSLTRDPFYVRNKTLRGAPYDFRRSPNENPKFLSDLKVLIEETYINSGNRSLVIIAHSLGGLYFLTFLKNQSESWNEKHIGKFICLSVPLAGSVKALKVEASGDNFDILGLSATRFRPVQRSLPSTAYLITDKRIRSPTEPIIITPTVNYTAHDYERFFKDINFDLGSVMMQKSKGTSDHFVGPKGIKEIYCVHGSGIPTAIQLVYRPETWYRKAFPDQDPVLVTGDGDGTVEKRSLEVCSQWPQAQHIVLDGAEHMKIVSDPRLIDLSLKVAGADGH